MNKATSNSAKNPTLLIAFSAVLILSACTGGDGDSITLSTDDAAGDPVTVAVPIAYIERPVPAPEGDLPNLRSPTAFFPGAELLIRPQSSADDEEISVNEKILAIVAEEEDISIDNLTIDIKDLETSYDGNILLFAARIVAEPVDNNLELTTWNLWQYNFTTEQVSYVIPSRLLRNEGFENGSAQDTAPHFLTDDRILFSSTRQFIEQGRQLNEGRAQIYPALGTRSNEATSVLHVFDPNNNSDQITQISFNRNHDLDATVRASGEIVFSHSNFSPNQQISLYRINPSGRHLSMLYGSNSGNSGSTGSNVHFTQPRELADGRLAAIIQPLETFALGGDIVIIDSDNYVEFNQGIWGNETSTEGGQQPLTTQAVRTDELRSEGGHYAAFYPLNDDTGRLLVSWSPCRILVDNIPKPCNIVDPSDDEVIAPPLYGVWINDPSAGTQQPLVLAQEGVFISEIVAGVPRDFPAIPDELGDVEADLASDEKGLLLIDSVYDLDGVDASPLGIASHAEPGAAGYTNRPARFIRLIKPVPIPDDDIFDIPRYAFGVNNSQSMREIIGYSVVEPDGSVAVTVPANTAFGFSVLDANGRRISNRHDHWLQLGPGEVLHCSGCHTTNSPLAHGRTTSRPDSSNPGARTLAGSIGFLNANPSLFASAEGETMAQIYLQHLPPRNLQLGPVYSDDWSDPALVTPDPDINFNYPNNWSDDDSLPANVDNIGPGSSMVVANLDPSKDSRIVINYIDHIQTIWDRQRLDNIGNTVSCSGCHIAADDIVPPGQLDLGTQASDIQPPEHYRSYHELVLTDIRQITGIAGDVINHVRSCEETILDADGNELTVTTQVNVTIAASMRVGSAINSNRFFGCFEGGICGHSNDPVPVLPANCTEPNGTIVPSTANTVDHQGLLSDAELRLLSEWLDIGAQYYNNPFDSRLSQ